GKACILKEDPRFLPNNNVGLNNTLPSVNPFSMSPSKEVIDNSIEDMANDTSSWKGIQVKLTFVEIIRLDRIRQLQISTAQHQQIMTSLSSDDASLFSPLNRYSSSKQNYRIGQRKGIMKTSSGSSKEPEWATALMEKLQSLEDKLSKDG